MALIWLVQAVLTCSALAVTVWALRALDQEAGRVREAMVAVPLLARQSRLVRSEARRAEAARMATDDALGRRCRN